MTILAFNPAQEYNSRMTNSLQNYIRTSGMYKIEEENHLSETVTELVYSHPAGIRYAYIEEVGGMSEAPGQQSIISDSRLTYREAINAILRAENTQDEVTDHPHDDELSPR